MEPCEVEIRALIHERCRELVAAIPDQGKLRRAGNQRGGCEQDKDGEDRLLPHAVSIVGIPLGR